MEIKFEKPYLEELYLTGKCSDKKHRFQPQIIRKYIRVIDLLQATDVIESLFTINSLHYKQLSGDKSGIQSVRVNDQYRIEFTTQIISDPIITICNILELSNHYD